MLKFTNDQLKLMGLQTTQSIENILSGRWDHLKKICLEPPQYFLIVYVEHATGQTTYKYKIPYGLDKTYAANLSNYPLRHAEILIGLHLDMTGAIYDDYPVPEDALLTHVGIRTRIPIVYRISKRQFEEVKNIYLWSADMNASFWIPNSEYARMRIKLNVNSTHKKSIEKDPATSYSLPDNSQQIEMNVGILQSPVVYIHHEMNKNSRDNKIPTGEEHGVLGFMRLGWRWGRKANHGADWDYKPLIARVWGDWIRLGNYAKIIFADCFSNYHYGYVGAAGGLSEEDTLKISGIGHMLGESPKLSIPLVGPFLVKDEPESDRYAMSRGHQLFVQRNGPILTSEKETIEYIYPPRMLPWDRETKSSSRDVDLKIEQEKENARENEGFIRVKRYYSYVYKNQNIVAEPGLDNVKSFLRDYLFSGYGELFSEVKK